MLIKKKKKKVFQDAVESMKRDPVDQLNRERVDQEGTTFYTADRC